MEAVEILRAEKLARFVNARRMDRTVSLYLYGPRARAALEFMEL